jgi:TM2 domain-containing membrane protein YozV
VINLLIERRFISRFFIFTKNVLRIVPFIYYFISTVIVGQTTSGEINFFAPGNRLSFGSYLYSGKDYLRALNEFKEFLKYENRDTVRFRFAECFLRIGRYREAADNFTSLFFNSSLKDESRLAFLEAQFRAGDLNNFRSIAKQENYTTGKYSLEIGRLYFITHLMDNSILPDTNIFYSAFPDSNKNDIRKFYQRKKFPDYKNPVTAAILSSLIPGLGKIYVGEVSDGLTSLIATGLLTFLAVNNFKHNHDFRGWLFTGLAAFSYAGNIYGSAAAAQIFNAGIKFNFNNDVKIYFEKRNYFLPENYF